jgi:ribosomal protein S25
MWGRYQKALREKKDDKRYPHGIAILESKRWLRALDRGDATDPLDRGTPSNQILRYLSSAEIASNRQIRVGRLLITLELIERERLAQPLLYLSAFIEANQQDYYDLLQRVRMHGDWPATGVEQTAKQASVQAKTLLDLRDKLRAQLVDKPRAQLLMDELFKNPYVTVARAQQLLAVSNPTARAVINALAARGMLEEVTGRQWAKLYVSRPILRAVELDDAVGNQ